MPTFRMVQYHRRQYPAGIPLDIQEVAANFDVTQVQATKDYSLHTEFSFGKRRFANPHLIKYPAIRQAHFNDVPLLWRDRDWALQFASYIRDITKGLPGLSVIEIHPPFTDYTPSMAHFLDIYVVFDEAIRKHYPDVQVMIENRTSSSLPLSKWPFALSKNEDFLELTEHIEARGLPLRLALDVPQLYSAHRLTQSKADKVTTLLEDVRPVRHLIAGVHLWGSKQSPGNTRRSAHCGDFNDYFYGNMELKAQFLSALQALFDDEVTRNLVLEVNSNDGDVLSIINDLDTAGFRYI